MPGFFYIWQFLLFSGMIQTEFAKNVVEKIKTDDSILGLAVAGSWINQELDEYSDLDLILVTKEKISANRETMLTYAERFGNLISAFTGEHVGEPRLLICLYDEPMLHVDIKFLTPDELDQRVEDPIVLFERDNQISRVLSRSEAEWPRRNHQWFEDRFWTWIHYAAVKLGRGEYFECLGFLNDLRVIVLSSLLLEKNNRQPRGLRKLEKYLPVEDLQQLRSTIADYEPASIIRAIENAISIYQQLRKQLFEPAVILQTRAEERVLNYLAEIKKRIQQTG